MNSNNEENSTIHQDRDELHYEMVLKAHKQKRDIGEM